MDLREHQDAWCFFNPLRKDCKPEEEVPPIAFSREQDSTLAPLTLPNSAGVPQTTGTSSSARREADLHAEHPIFTSSKSQVTVQPQHDINMETSEGTSAPSIDQPVLVENRQPDVERGQQAQHNGQGMAKLPHSDGSTSMTSEAHAMHLRKIVDQVMESNAGILELYLQSDFPKEDVIEIINETVAQSKNELKYVDVEGLEPQHARMFYRYFVLAKDDRLEQKHRRDMLIRYLQLFHNLGCNMQAAENKLLQIMLKRAEEQKEGSLDILHNYLRIFCPDKEIRIWQFLSKQPDGVNLVKKYKSLPKCSASLSKPNSNVEQPYES